MKKIGMHQDKEIRLRVYQRLNLWEAGSHDGLLGGMEAKGEAREGRVLR